MKYCSSKIEYLNCSNAALFIKFHFPAGVHAPGAIFQDSVVSENPAYYRFNNYFSCFSSKDGFGGSICAEIVAFYTTKTTSAYEENTTVDYVSV